MEENKTIQMDLNSVSEVSFSMSTSKFDETRVNNLQLGFSNAVAIDEANNSLKVTFGVRYSQHDEVIIECVYNFVFTVTNLCSYVEKDKSGNMKIKDIMPHCLNVVVGTMRGILVVKTAGTVIGNYPIPMIDIQQLNNLLGGNPSKSID